MTIVHPPLPFSPSSTQTHTYKSCSIPIISPPNNIMGRKTIPKTVRIQVWNRWVGENYGKSKCYVCNQQDIYATHFECGHVRSVKENGENISVENLRPICRSCNSSMGIKNLENFKTIFFNI